MKNYKTDEELDNEFIEDMQADILKFWNSKWGERVKIGSVIFTGLFLLWVITEIMTFVSSFINYVYWGQ